MHDSRTTFSIRIVRFIIDIIYFLLLAYPTKRFVKAREQNDLSIKSFQGSGGVSCLVCSVFVSIYQPSTAQPVELIILFAPATRSECTLFKTVAAIHRIAHTKSIQHIVPQQNGVYNVCLPKGPNQKIIHKETKTQQKYFSFADRMLARNILLRKRLSIISNRNPLAVRICKVPRFRIRRHKVVIMTLA